MPVSPRLSYPRSRRVSSPAFSGDRGGGTATSATRSRDRLSQVASLDEDRILRQFVSTINAALRTNFCGPAASGRPSPIPASNSIARSARACPNPATVRDASGSTRPREACTAVARGARWTALVRPTRRLPYRILGLVRARQVETTVIVPGRLQGRLCLKNVTPAGRPRGLPSRGVACPRPQYGPAGHLDNKGLCGATVAA